MFFVILEPGHKPHSIQLHSIQFWVSAAIWPLTHQARVLRSSEMAPPFTVNDVANFVPFELYYRSAPHHLHHGNPQHWSKYSTFHELSAPKMLRSNLFQINFIEDIITPPLYSSIFTNWAFRTNEIRYYRNLIFSVDFSLHRKWIERTDDESNQLEFFFAFFYGNWAADTWKSRVQYTWSQFKCNYYVRKKHTDFC